MKAAITETVLELKARYRWCLTGTPLQVKRKKKGILHNVKQQKCQKVNPSFFSHICYLFIYFRMNSLNYIQSLRF